MSRSSRPAGRALRLTAKFADATALHLQPMSIDAPTPSGDEALVEVHAAAVNPSDAKAALGLMPHAIWPRTPGRDYAGTVVEGPTEWRGAHVFGTGGDLGITRDGSHARYLRLPLSALTRKPDTLSLPVAGALGVPFVTAYEGLRRAGFDFVDARDRTVLVLGANGAVGQAVTQLATRAGAQVFGVARASSYRGHASGEVPVVDARRPDFAAALSEAIGGRKIDVAYNTVGSTYFQTALAHLGVGGTQVLIATLERSVPFDILAFYRRNQHMLGVDTLKLTAVDCAQILDALLLGFDCGSLQGFPVGDAALMPLERAGEAYRRVLSGSSERIVLTPR